MSKKDCCLIGQDLGEITNKAKDWWQEDCDLFHSIVRDSVFCAIPLDYSVRERETEPVCLFRDIHGR